MMIVGANTSNNTITQIETFDGPESSRFVRRTTDDFGGNNSDYSWSVDLGELTGSTESLWVLCMRIQTSLCDHLKETLLTLVT